MKIETYILKAVNGKKIRKATRVIFGPGKCVNFMEFLTKKEAIKQAKQLMERNPGYFS